MKKSGTDNKKIVVILSLLIIVLSTVAALAGIFSSQVKEYEDVVTSYGETIKLYQKGLYARDSVSMASQAIAQDVVTLMVAIPLLAVSLWLVRKQNRKGDFLLTGTVGYFLYTYMSYSFLIVFNVFYLVYVILMALSFYAFVLCLIELNRTEIEKMFTERFPKRALSIFFLISGIMIFGMWLGRIIPALADGSAPVGLEHYSTLAIQTLDLGFVVPACMVTAYLLGKRKKWGYLLCSVLVVKMVTMTGAVSAMILLMQKNGVSVSMGEKLLFPTLLLISGFFLVRMLKEMKP